MAQQLVVRFDEQFLREERVEQLARVSALHEQPRLRCACVDKGTTLPFPDVNSCRSSARPRCSRDMTVPIGIDRALAMSLYGSSSTSLSTMTSWYCAGIRLSAPSRSSSVRCSGTGGTNGTVDAIASSVSGTSGDRPLARRLLLRTWCRIDISHARQFVPG